MRVSPLRASVLRLAGPVLLVLAVQLGFIWYLGGRGGIEARRPAPGAELQLVGGGYSELLQLLDPTLFALPHEQGFAGSGWLLPPEQEIQPFAWSEPPRWLDLPLERLGLVTPDAAAALPETLPPPASAEADLLLPPLAQTTTFEPRPSLKLTGDLASRRLLTSPDLPPQPSRELVSNSVVQVVVDREGLPFSAVLLEHSGHPAADRRALAETRKLRFDKAAVSSGQEHQMSWGTLVFQWETVPVSSTNAPPSR